MLQICFELLNTGNSRLSSNFQYYSRTTGPYFLASRIVNGEMDYYYVRKNKTNWEIAKGRLYDFFATSLRNIITSIQIYFYTFRRKFNQNESPQKTTASFGKKSCEIARSHFVAEILLHGQKTIEIVM